MKVKLMVLMMMVSFLSLNALESGIGRVSHIKGEVYIQRGSELGFESATINFPVTEGDRIATADGMAEIYIGNSNYLRLDRDTKIDILSLPNKRDEAVLRLWAGNLYLSIKRIYNEKDIEVQVDDVTIYVLQPGLYRINSLGKNYAEVFVIKGAIEVEGFNGNAIVRSNQSLLWENGELQRVRTFYSSSYDAFDDFNEARESLISRTRVQRYLPPELYDYEWELTCYGRWHYLSPYGWVWIPPYVFSGWRPYYWGRWVWYPWGWTWIPYEPWGWVTFHFGRWHWHISFGWYWVPTTVWGPAWVHWTWGDYWIGWCPIDIYNRPVIVINNYWVTHYHDHAPSNSSSFVFVRKEQLMAPDIRRAVLEKDKISQLGTVPIYKSQPALRPSFLSPSVENYKGKIMLKNQPPVLNEENVSQKAMPRSMMRREDLYNDEKGSITSGPKINRKYELDNRFENRERDLFVKPKEGPRIEEEESSKSDRRFIKPNSEEGFRSTDRRFIKPAPDYERGTTQEDFRSIERRERNVPFYRNDYVREKEIRIAPRNERLETRESFPIFRRETPQKPSYNEEKRSSSIKDVFRPFSGTGSSNKPSERGSFFKAPSNQGNSWNPSSNSSSGGKAIRKKSD